MNPAAAALSASRRSLFLSSAATSGSIQKGWYAFRRRCAVCRELPCLWCRWLQQSPCELLCTQPRMTLPEAASGPVRRAAWSPLPPPPRRRTHTCPGNAPPLAGTTTAAPATGKGGRGSTARGPHSSSQRLDVPPSGKLMACSQKLPALRPPSRRRCRCRGNLLVSTCCLKLAPCAPLKTLCH